MLETATTSQSLAPSEAAREAVASLRREFIFEALDGAVWQAQGAMRLLKHGNDMAAAQAMARMFDFARKAAAEMKALQARGDGA